MAKTLLLFNYHRRVIGTAMWNKKNATVSVSYDNKIHYPDTTLRFDEFDEYKRLRGILDERDLNQLTLEDLICSPQKTPSQVRHSDYKETSVYQ